MENIIKLQKERAEVLRKIGEQVDKDRTYWVNALTKIEPRATAIDEIDKSVRTLKSYDKELRFLEDRSPIGQFRISLPFNNPIYSFIIYCCGIAVGGNTVIVRPSKMTCDYVQEFFSKYEQFKDIGISLYIGSGKAFIEAACKQSTPGGLLFTGAFDNLQDIQNKIPNSQQLIYCGSGINPTIIGPNVSDIDDAIDLVINSRIYNSGQDCLSTEKIVVHESVYDKFIERLICKLDKLHLGIAGDKTADIYPPIPGILNEITARYNEIKAKEICLYDRHDNGCILSVFEVGLNSESLNMEKFCPIFTVAKYIQIIITTAKNLITFFFMQIPPYFLSLLYPFCDKKSTIIYNKIYKNKKTAELPSFLLLKIHYFIVTPSHCISCRACHSFAYSFCCSRGCYFNISYLTARNFFCNFVKYSMVIFIVKLVDIFSII